MKHAPLLRKFGSVKRDPAVTAAPLPRRVEALFRLSANLSADSTTIQGGKGYFV
jgi:hypothetical protein